MLKIAIAKGRVFAEAVSLLKKINIEIPKEEINSRKIIMHSNNATVKILLIRSIDVPVFVRHGGADIGIVGKDVLLENNNKGIFELLDLKIANCRLVLASKNGEIINKPTLKIATKYDKSAKKYFQSKGQQIDVIKLYGSMEIAPNIGLADYIVDLVDTGNTMKANNLKIIDEVCNISSRLIVNSASFNTKNKEIKNLIDNIMKTL